ncbi:hypothetical protein BMI87_10025 [Thioclava sp. F28-4]|nr:hypothetical protein BMI87_10025 [Thioclava sp. F28-4]
MIQISRVIEAAMRVDGVDESPPKVMRALARWGRIVRTHPAIRTVHAPREREVQLELSGMRMRRYENCGPTIVGHRGKRDLQGQIDNTPHRVAKDRVPRIERPDRNISLRKCECEGRQTVLMVQGPKRGQDVRRTAAQQLG